MRRIIGTFKDIAVIAGVNPNVVTRWVREYRAGKLIPEEKKLDVAEERLSLLRSIDRSLKTIITLLDPPLPDDLMSKLDDEFNGD